MPRRRAGLRRKTGPHPVDIHVGKQLQAQRTLCGMSQSDLADKLGITFQQIQKYETGTNRTTAGRLWQASQILGVAIEYFFEGLDSESEAANDLLHTRAGLEFVRFYENCPEGIQKAMYHLGKSIADEDNSRERKKAK